jgi:hypothetical protein
METNLEKPSNPRMSNPDGVYASEARLEDCVTLRDNFAGIALQGILNNGLKINDESKVLEAYEAVSLNAYLIADAMLKVRQKTEL